MKFKVWDKTEKKWYRPVYEAQQGRLEELLITMSGELCLRKLENGEVSFIHESLFANRFIKAYYTGKRDIDNFKLYQFDIVQTPDGNKHVIDMADISFDDERGNIVGFLIPNNCTKIGNKFDNPQLL